MNKEQTDEAQRKRQNEYMQGAHVWKRTPEEQEALNKKLDETRAWLRERNII